VNDTNTFRLSLVSLIPTHSQTMVSNGVRQLDIFPREIGLACFQKKIRSTNQLEISLHLQRPVYADTDCDRHGAGSQFQLKQLNRVSRVNPLLTVMEAFNLPLNILVLLYYFTKMQMHKFRSLYILTICLLLGTFQL